MNWTEEQYEEYLNKRGIQQRQHEKKSKYHARKVKVDGICFDSQKEADYYYNLKVLLNAGAIKGFCRQCEFVLQEGNEDTQPIRYYADFIVFKNDGTTEIVDTKGIQTDVFKLKFKMFKNKFPGLKLELK